MRVIAHVHCYLRYFYFHFLSFIWPLGFKIKPLYWGATVLLYMLVSFRLPFWFVFRFPSNPFLALRTNLC